MKHEKSEWLGISQHSSGSNENYFNEEFCTQLWVKSEDKRITMKYAHPKCTFYVTLLQKLPENNFHQKWENKLRDPITEERQRKELGDGGDGRFQGDSQAPDKESCESRFVQCDYGNRNPEAAVTKMPTASLSWTKDGMPQILNYTWQCKQCVDVFLLSSMSLTHGSAKDIWILLWHTPQREVMVHLKAEHTYKPKCVDHISADSRICANVLMQETLSHGSLLTLLSYFYRRNS